jgi:hypothetical protein
VPLPGLKPPYAYKVLSTIDRIYCNGGLVTNGSRARADQRTQFGDGGGCRILAATQCEYDDAKTPFVRFVFQEVYQAIDCRRVHEGKLGKGDKKASEEYFIVTARYRPTNRVAGDRLQFVAPVK